MLSEKSLGSDFVLVQNVHERDGVLGQRSCEDYDFEVFRNLFDERDTAWSNKHVDVADATFNVDREDNVCLVGRGKG